MSSPVPLEVVSPVLKESGVEIIHEIDYVVDDCQGWVRSLPRLDVKIVTNLSESEENIYSPSAMNQYGKFSRSGHSHIFG